MQIIIREGVTEISEIQPCVDYTVGESPPKNHGQLHGNSSRPSNNPQNEETATDGGETFTDLEGVKPTLIEHIKTEDSSGGEPTVASLAGELNTGGHDLDPSRNKDVLETLLEDDEDHSPERLDEVHSSK